MEKLPTGLLGVLKSVCLWALDAFKAPGRLKALATAASAQSDQRAKCLNCPAGRVTDLKDGGSYNSLMLGVCNTCGTTWYVDPGLGAVHSVASPRG